MLCSAHQLIPAKGPLAAAFGGSPDVVEESVKMFVAKSGLCAVSVDYRLAPEHPYPTGHQDCYRVLKWIGENAASFGGDREHIFVAGDSAGGTLTQFNCIWVAVAGHFVPGWLYNIGATVLNGGVSMVVFFFVNKIIFPEGEPQKK